MYWFRISPTICRAATLACAGAIAMKKSPPVHRARSVKPLLKAPVPMVEQATRSLVEQRRVMLQTGKDGRVLLVRLGGG